MLVIAGDDDWIFQTQTALSITTSVTEYYAILRNSSKTTISLCVKSQLYYSNRSEGTMDREEFQKAYGKVVAKAWGDHDFKAKLFADPKTVLKENGVEIPEDVEFRVVENTEEVVHLILPPEPSEQLSEEELEKVAGGNAYLCGLSGPFNHYLLN
jgi:hypothetical protein